MARGRLALRAFAADDRGASTVEWIVIAAVATGLGLMLLTSAQDSLGRYSADVRTEVQGNTFDAEWARDLPVQMD